MKYELTTESRELEHVRRDLSTEAIDRVGGWQPIETAPMDETPVDLWARGRRMVGYKRMKGDNYWQPIEGGIAVIREATHFMLPPSPPREKAE